MKQNKFLPFIFLLLLGLTFTLLVSKPLTDTQTLELLTNELSTEIPEFHGMKVVPPPLASLTTIQQVLGLATDNQKRIEVDLTRQRVLAYEGDRLLHEFIVSTGKWGWTPTGEFTIWAKVKSQLMKGGSKALHTYYYLPNVPYVMFFYNKDTSKIRGFSFHGTYWHNNFGHPMSHGCINMKTEDAKTLYEWTTPVVTNAKAWSTLATADNPGTKVVIYGTTPNE